MGADRVRERRPRTRPEGSRGGPGDGAAVLRHGVRSLGAINCRALPTVQLATGEAGSAAWERPSTKAGSDRARTARSRRAETEQARPPGGGPGHLGRAWVGRGLGKAGRFYKRLQRLTRAPNRAAGPVGGLGARAHGAVGARSGVLGAGRRAEGREVTGRQAV